MSEPAFPSEILLSSGGQFGKFGTYPGLTKRELFAMAAMQGMLSTTVQHLDGHEIVEAAVCYADALLSALNSEDAKS